MITWLVWTIWTLMSAVLKRPLNLITHSLPGLTQVDETNSGSTIHCLSYTANTTPVDALATLGPQWVNDTGNNVIIYIYRYVFFFSACSFSTATATGACGMSVTLASVAGKRRKQTYCIVYGQTSNIRHMLVSNKLVDHSDVVEASPVGAAPTTSSFST